MGISGDQGVLEPFFASITQARRIEKNLISLAPLVGVLEGGVKS